MRLYCEDYEVGYENGQRVGANRRKGGYDQAYLEEQTNHAHFFAKQREDDTGWRRLAYASGFAAGWRDGWGK